MTVENFLGFISTNTLSSVTLRPDGLPGAAYWARAHNVTLAMVSQIPEPATCGMLMAGLRLVGFMARRRLR
jgi:hypothetical protein